jgi:hypothetical protein
MSMIYNRDEMKKKTRTILFIACVLTFLLATPGVVLYSQGYRFDFEEKELTTKGGLYCRILPKKADLYINEQFIESTSIFANSVFLNDLAPGEYQIEIKKEGYYSWEKTLEVKEKQVAQAKNIILFPKEIEIEEILLEESDDILEKMGIEEEKEIPEILEETDFNDFLFSPDKKKIAYYADQEIRIIFLEEYYNLSKKAGEETVIEFSDEISDIYWLNSYYIVLVIGNELIVTEIDDRDEPNIVKLAEFKKPSIYWERDKKVLYLLSENILYGISNLIP